MLRIFLLFILLFPNISYADQGLNLTCKNLLSALGRHYEPLNFKLEVTGFHYFDKDHNEFKVIPSEELVFGDDMFVAKFPEYELGFNARMDFEFYTSITRVREKVFILNRNKRYEDFLVENFEKY